MADRFDDVCEADEGDLDTIELQFTPDQLNALRLAAAQQEREQQEEEERRVRRAQEARQAQREWQAQREERQAQRALQPRPAPRAQLIPLAQPTSVAQIITPQMQPAPVVQPAPQVQPVPMAQPAPQVQPAPLAKPTPLVLPVPPVQPTAPLVQSVPPSRRAQRVSLAVALKRHRPGMRKTAALIAGVAGLAAVCGLLLSKQLPDWLSDAQRTPIAVAAPKASQPAPPPPIPRAFPAEAPPLPEAIPVRFVNPFDRTEVFEFPPGTSPADARDAVAQLLLERARERRDEIAKSMQRRRNDRPRDDGRTPSPVTAQLGQQPEG